MNRLDETIYSGHDVIVRTMLEMPGDNLVITFTSRRQNPKTTRAGFGIDFFSKRGIPAVYIVSTRNHWWQVPEMAEALDAIDALGLRSRFSNITVYGSSMGAHGALVFSGRLKADRVLAFSPQFALHGRDSAWNPAWALETKGLIERHRPEDGISPSADILVGIDPFIKSDMMHLKAIRRVRDVTVLSIPFGLHPPMRYLQDAHLLSPLVEQVVSGNFHISDFRKRLRQGRRHNLRYLMGLAGRLRRRKSHKILAPVLTMATDEIAKRLRDGASISSPEDAAVLLATAVDNNALPVQDALALVNEMLVRSPGIPQLHSTRAEFLLKIGDFQGAVSTSRRAVKCNRASLDIRLKLAAMLFRVGQPKEARETVEGALEIRERGVKTWKRFFALYKSELDENSIRAIQRIMNSTANDALMQIEREQ